MTDQTPNTPRLGAIYPDDMWVDLDAQAVVDDFRSYLPENVELISSATPIPPRDAAQLEENQDGVRCLDGYNLCLTGNVLDDHPTRLVCNVSPTSEERAGQQHNLPRPRSFST